ncbi:protein CNGC15c-like isoform X2 [Quercus lobata]|uniref:protein CNGC15c-like isoform X2 n=1 Tax=Quercus lobata TaxID=97700 RepID=UPI001243D62E|nr:protein CNGC15c-like isoform X2 [Quercus lobata]
MGHRNSRLKRTQVLDDSEVADSVNDVIENYYYIDGTKCKTTPKSKPKKANDFSEKTRSFKDKVLRRVFSEDYEKEKKRILDPSGKTISNWNKIFSIACLISLFVDPMFLLSPIMRAQVCSTNATSLQVVLTIVRSVLDVFYVIQIIVRFHTAYVAPSSRIFGRGELVIDPSKIAMRYLRRGFWMDLLVSLPLPQVSGAWWYILAIERQEACWRSVCSLESPSCQNVYFDCRSVNDVSRANWFNSTNVTNLCNTNASPSYYQYGIFGDAVTTDVVAAQFFTKYFYCLWWGLRQLSSIGNNMFTSTSMGEDVFALVVATLGLFLLALLIGNMQRFLQSATLRLEEWRIMRTDTEQWMKYRQMPPELKQRIRQYDQYKWLATRGVDEEKILNSLPMDLRIKIKRHLCLSLVRGVPLFNQMDETMLDAICERLKPALCTKNMFLVREGDPVKQMLFIIRGHLWSYTTDGGRSGSSNSYRIGSGDFCGEELLTWALDPRPNVIFPSSTHMMKAITEVEAFALGAVDLKFVVSQFRRLHGKQLKHIFRVYSHQWRTWAACFIQATWRRHKKLKEMAEIGARERERAPRDYFWMRYAETLLESSRSMKVVNNSAESSSSDVNLLQKPAEPNFD